VIFLIDEQQESHAIPFPISPGKLLLINSGLTLEQQGQLVKILQEQFGAFAWKYSNMKGIHPDTCIHHIYIRDDIRPIRQPQRRMNPALKDIVKE